MHPLELNYDQLIKAPVWVPELHLMQVNFHPPWLQEVLPAWLLKHVGKDGSETSSCTTDKAKAGSDTMLQREEERARFHRETHTHHRVYRQKGVEIDTEINLYRLRPRARVGSTNKH